MDSTVKFISELDGFVEMVLAMLDNFKDSEILISGTFDNYAYRDILNRIVAFANLANCKMIIPYISRNGIISRTYVNKIITAAGEVRLNSKFTNNLIIIRDHAFIISFNYRYSSVYGVKGTFESCILTNLNDAVMDVKKLFMNNWHNSLPLKNA